MRGDLGSGRAIRVVRTPKLVGDPGPNHPTQEMARSAAGPTAGGEARVAPPQVVQVVKCDTEPMRRSTVRLLLLPLLLMASAALPAQQGPDAFHWADFHSPKDQDIVVWVTRSMAVEDWSAIREIGVEYDAALVVTSKRANPQGAANADSFALWSVSLTDHTLYPILKGVNLRWLDWMRFADGAPEELALLYDNCRDCQANTYFTALHYDVTRHGFTARWMRSGDGAPLWTDSSPAGMVWTQSYAGVAEPNGREMLYTWSHFDYGKQKEPSDSIYRYDVDPVSGLERALPILGKDVDVVKMRVCKGQDAIPGLVRGQDSALCQQIAGTRPDRHPVTTPPANNRGRSVPPGSR